MSHLIDNSKGFNALILNGAPAWHGLGTVQNAVSTLDALQKGGLDFTVLKMPNVHCIPIGNDEYKEIVSDESFFTYRTDTNTVLGSKVGKTYMPMQNVEALNVVDEILASGTATIESAGAIDGGKRIFICLSIAKNIVVGSSDIVKQYFLIATSHDGTLSITGMPTNLRVVCYNTLSAALGEKSVDKIKIRHTINASSRLNEAMRVLKLIKSNTNENEDNYNKMAETVISRETMWNYFGNVFYSPDEIKSLQAGNKEAISKQKKNIIDEVNYFATKGTGQALAMKGSDFTLWSAYNAVTGYISRKKYSNANDRANSMLFGTAAEQINNAGVLALNPAKIQTLSKISFTDLNMN